MKTYVLRVVVKVKRPTISVPPTQGRVGSQEGECLIHISLTLSWKSAVDMRLLDLKVCWGGGGNPPQEIALFQEMSAFI